MIYNFSEITQLHLEITSNCNAACPLCPRNYLGYPMNLGYVEHDMTLAEAQKIFSPTFLAQLKNITINGNFGDMVMNPHTIDILKYFKEQAPQVRIDISTNGGARDRSFWTSLATVADEVSFCLDGLEDTHHLYRQNTVFSTVLKNAQTFINAGGAAVWKMIKFDHNAHQQEACRELSKTMGFMYFLLVNDGRNQGPVFDKNKKISHWIGTPLKKVFGPEDIFEDFLNWDVNSLNKINHPTEFPDIPDHVGKFATDRIIQWQATKTSVIHCQVKQNKSLYVSSTGDVYPCCYLGFNPKKFQYRGEQGHGNIQLSKLISENNALEYDLEHCITWFNKVSESWSRSSVADGAILSCITTCGRELPRLKEELAAVQLTGDALKVFNDYCARRESRLSTPDPAQS